MNDPLRFFDPDGRTEEERNKAVDRARKYVEKNPDKSKKLYGFAGYHKGTPGKQIDCSGLVSDCSNSAGKGYLNNGTGKGVENVVNNCRATSFENARVGDFVTLYNGAHIAIITQMGVDDDGKNVPTKIIHASSSRGPVEDKVNDYYMSNFDKDAVYQWDTPEMILPEVKVTPNSGKLSTDKNEKKDNESTTGN